MSVDVLVVGDANPDLLAIGDTVPRFGQAEQMLHSADLVLGGSAAIVASGLARLGIRTALVSVVGDDDFGHLVLGRLRERGVDVSRVSIHPQLPTGLSIVLSQPDDRAILTLPGTIPVLRGADVRAAVEELHPAHVHFASYFLQPDLAKELPDLLDWLADQGTRVSLDTNWDPDERWEGLAEILPRVGVFLPNREEACAVAATIASRPVTDTAAAGCILSALGVTVVIKAGSEGGYAFSDGALVSTAPGLVLAEVIDTTGAGDSFDAGYLASEVRQVSGEYERLRWAAVAGSLSVRGRGGTAAQPTVDEILEALE